MKKRGRDLPNRRQTDPNRSLPLFILDWICQLLGSPLKKTRLPSHLHVLTYSHLTLAGQCVYRGRAVCTPQGSPILDSAAFAIAAHKLHWRRHGLLATGCQRRYAVRSRKTAGRHSFALRWRFEACWNGGGDGDEVCVCGVV